MLLQTFPTLHTSLAYFQVITIIATRFFQTNDILHGTGNNFTWICKTNQTRVLLNMSPRLASKWGYKINIFYQYSFICTDIKQLCRPNLAMVLNWLYILSFSIFPSNTKIWKMHWFNYAQIKGVLDTIWFMELI